MCSSKLYKNQVYPFSWIISVYWHTSHFFFLWLSLKHLWCHNSIGGSVTVGAQGTSKLSLIEEQVSPTWSILKSTMLRVMMISIPTSAPCLKYSKSTHSLAWLDYITLSRYYRDGIGLQLKSKVCPVLSLSTAVWSTDGCQMLKVVTA